MLETNEVVDLLPDREATTLAPWLRNHPGFEIVAHDRAGAYADGIRQGASALLPRKPMRGRIVPSRMFLDERRGILTTRRAMHAIIGLVRESFEPAMSVQ